MNLAIINSYIKIKIKSYDSYFYNNHKKNDSVIIDIPPEHLNFTKNLKHKNNNNNEIKITIDDYKEPKSPNSPNSPIFPINEWDML